MVMLLGSLAHNVLVWAQGWLAATASLMRHYGPWRLVRDVLHISGFLFLDARGHVRQIGLNQDAPLLLFYSALSKRSSLLRMSPCI
jgi:hypothetical protein